MNLVHGLTIGTALMLVTAGLSLIFGIMGVLNFAHGSLFMLGAYFGLTVERLTGNFWLALLIAPLIVAGIAILLERSAIRPLYGMPPLKHLLVTFGISLMISDIVPWIWGSDLFAIKKPLLLEGGFLLAGTQFPYFRLFILLFSSALVFLMWYTLKYSRYGLAIRAGIHDIEMVDALGINIHKTFMVTFSVGSALASVAGVIIGALRTVNPVMGVDIITDAFVVVVIGGLGSFKGAVVGSLILGLTVSFGVMLFALVGMPYLAKFSIYIALVIILLFKPEGLFKEV